jgi:hypothetical protein
LDRENSFHARPRLELQRINVKYPKGSSMDGSRMLRRPTDARRLTPDMLCTARRIHTSLSVDAILPFEVGSGVAFVCLMSKMH